MTAPAKTRKRRVAVVVVLLLILAAIAYLIYLAIPGHRTAFLVDTSESRVDIGAIAASIGSAARNAGDRDAVSLRRFGGTCGAADNTAELVSSGTGQGEQVASAARKLTSAGKVTLESGVLAAIDDFSGLYPFRGLRGNRIVVVTSHGTDACARDQNAVLKAIRERVAAAGLTLEFRFVGFQVPDGQRDELQTLARASGAPEPRFVRSAAELDVALRELVIPDFGLAKPLELPSERESKPAKEYDFAVALLTGWGVTVTGAPVQCHAATGETDHSRTLCRFRLAEGQRIRLAAKVSGPDPNPMRARNNPNYRPINTPFWYGCDEGSMSRTCTVTMSRERLAKAVAKSGDAPSTSMMACVTTRDPATDVLAATCAAITGSEPPPTPAVTYADGSVDSG
ncbi:hypothetical protein [Nonomuraea guangzhouensis]|uniref:VWFA domain-containing protein n=1 Tax=Nonomuraea guangzhouensis TaxID=1291555 RepID=A0ABW4G482_9ACTN|nr:hypothetical protein [Nonomuraea guangzhouensis]